MTVEEIGDANQTVARGQLPRLAAKGEGNESRRSGADRTTGLRSPPREGRDSQKKAMLDR
jgi:hypothetical protein